MAGRVPGVVVVAGALGERQQRVLVDAGEPALVECLDINRVALVLLDDRLGVGVGVEAVHEDERHVCLVRAVQVLDLAHHQVEEALAVAHLNHRLWSDAAHRRAEATVELEHRQLVEMLGLAVGLGDLAIVHHLLGVGGLDAIPRQLVAADGRAQIALVEREEVVHLLLERCALWFGDRVGELVQCVAHLGGSNIGAGLVQGKRTGFAYVLVRL